jgi:hypothetical protein
MPTVSSGAFGLYADGPKAARDLEEHALFRQRALHVLQPVLAMSVISARYRPAQEEFYGLEAYQHSVDQSRRRAVDGGIVLAVGGGLTLR